MSAMFAVCETAGEQWGASSARVTHPTNIIWVSLPYPKPELGVVAASSHRNSFSKSVSKMFERIENETSNFHIG